MRFYTRLARGGIGSDNEIISAGDKEGVCICAFHPAV